MIDVWIDSLPIRRLLAVEHRGDYMGVGAAFEKVFTTAAMRGLLRPDTVSLGIFYNDPSTTPVDQLRSHACVTVPETLTVAPDGCELLTLDGGEFAIGIHRGPYQRLHESYSWLFGQWLPSSGREPADRPCHEIYVNNPRETPPEQLVTHICLPLAPAKQPASEPANV
jgi:AraC family transcriptional regulator